MNVVRKTMEERDGEKTRRNNKIEITDDYCGVSPAPRQKLEAKNNTTRYRVVSRRRREVRDRMRNDKIKTG